MRSSFLSVLIFLLNFIFLAKSIQCKSMPFDEREVVKLSDCKKPTRTNSQLITLNATRRRRLTFSQLILKKMFKMMMNRRKSIAANFVTGASIGRRRRQRRPVKLRPNRPNKRPSLDYSDHDD